VKINLFVSYTTIFLTASPLYFIYFQSNHEFEISTCYPRSTGTKHNGNIISGDVSIANGPSLSNGVSAAQIAKEKIKRRVDTVNSDVVGSSGVEVDDRKLGKDETRANRCLPFSISQGLRSIFSNESVDIPSKSKMSRGNVTSSLEGERNCDENRIISSLQLISKRNPSPRSSEAVRFVMILIHLCHIYLPSSIYYNLVIIIFSILLH
jgi:hypothetical protein